jgi:II/X family phage/plasmid replication protein
MIDTVRFLIPIEDKQAIEKIKGMLTRTRRENLKTKELKYEYFLGEIKVGSYSRSINFKVDDNGIYVEFSLPKYKYGNNVEMLRPIKVVEVLESFHNELCKSIEKTLPPVSEWIVCRLDISYNWTLESKEKCQSLMNFIQRIDFPRKKPIHYDTSVMYKGTAYSIKFYLKGPEFLKNDFKAFAEIDEEKAHQLANWAHKILRFEVEFRKGYLKELFGKKEVYISDIANDYHIEEILKYYLARVFKYINKENMKNENVWQLISDNYTKAKAYRLYNFYRDFYYDKGGKFRVQKSLDRSTIYRYKKDLKRIGVSFTENIDDTRIVSINELIIPSKKAKFTLLDYQLDTDYS